MKKLLAGIALLLAASGLFAQDHPPVTKFTRASAALKLVERSDSYEKGSFARWTGVLALRGKLVLEFDRAPLGEQESENAGVAFFEPDARSRAKLPAATNYYALSPMQVDLGKPPIDVLPALIGREKALQVILSKSPRFELPVAIVLTEYRTDVECDHRSYAMQYSSIRAFRRNAVALAVGRATGC